MLFRIVRWFCLEFRACSLRRLNHWRKMHQLSKHKINFWCKIESRMTTIVTTLSRKLEDK